MRSLPEHQQLAELDTRVTQLGSARVRAETAVSDLEKEQRKADADVEQVRNRRVRDQQRLDSGNVNTAKDLTNLQHEIVSLDRRIAELEDAELEVMEALETAQAELARVQADLVEQENQRDALQTRIEEAVGKADSEGAGVRAEREQTAGRLPEDLLALYEKLRDQHGTGAAVLYQRRCEGCRLEINAADLREIKAAADDEVLRCPECQRILVRTPESGL